MMNLPSMFKSAIAGLLLLTSSACTTPDQQNYEDGWIVTRNQCNDVSSMIKNKTEYETSIQRQITLLDQQNRNIYKLDLIVTRAGRDWTSTTYSNDLANRELKKSKIKRTAINTDASTAIDAFYNQPGKHREIDYNCLFKGMPQ